MAHATISLSGLRIVKLLIGKPPQSIANLIKSTGTTRTAVKAQLDTLLRVGFVKCHRKRSGNKGRPLTLYHTTEAAFHLFGSNQGRLFASALWKSMAETVDGELLNNVSERVAEDIANYYLSKITTKKSTERLDEMISLMNAEGALIETVTQNGHAELHLRCCPFSGITDEKCSLCNVGLAMMSSILGKPLRRIASRYDGSPCCIFEISR